MTAIRPFLRNFLRDDRGSITIEAMLMMPILVWCYLGVFVFFDGYRAQAINEKTSYTLGDTLSRETGYVTPAYVDSLFQLTRVMVQRTTGVRMRISVIRYNQADDSYRVVWTQVRGGAIALTNTMLNSMEDAIPELPNNEKIILTETWVDYEPDYEVGMDEFTFYNIVPTDIRFANQLCYNTLNTGGTAATATC
jgi:hypothetical protein